MSFLYGLIFVSCQFNVFSRYKFSRKRQKITKYNLPKIDPNSADFFAGTKFGGFSVFYCPITEGCCSITKEPLYFLAYRA